MKQFVVAGVDVSKLSLDICIKPEDSQLHISNGPIGFRTFWRKLKPKIRPDTVVLVIMEHTGSYTSRFEKFLFQKKVGYCKVPAMQIKRSLGVIRGKNDRVDAQRIAEYGWLRKEILVADKPVGEEIGKLRQLLSLRAKLVRDRAGYICRLKEVRATTDLKKSDPVIAINLKMMATITANIKLVEKHILELVGAVKELKITYDLIKSIKGVGPVVAAYMIAVTANFKQFSKARQFNCYAGLAPFRYESGTSIKGRSRVSHLANKQAKTLLNLAASCAIRYDQELKTYYAKRVAEGKKKMSCLNIIRSKMVARIFSVAKRGTPYFEVQVAA